MSFPSELAFKDKMAALAKTFQYRVGPTVLLAALFMMKEETHWHVFGMVIAGWFVFDALNKLYFSAQKR